MPISHRSRLHAAPRGAKRSLCLALGAALATIAPLAPAQTAGETPASIKLPGTETSLRIGGYMKFDAVFSDKSAGVNSQADQRPPLRQPMTTSGASGFPSAG